MAGHADLAAAGLEQHGLIEVMPLLDRDFKPGGQGRRPGERDAHELFQAGTPVLARVRIAGCRGPLSWIRFRQ